MVVLLTPVGFPVLAWISTSSTKMEIINVKSLPRIPLIWGKIVDPSDRSDGLTHDLSQSHWKGKTIF